MENHHFVWENPLSITIFNSYVKLPEGISSNFMKFMGFNNPDAPCMAYLPTFTPKMAQM
jgi:hypothetical protein